MTTVNQAYRSDAGREGSARPPLSRALAVAVTLVAVAGLAATWQVLVRRPAGQRLDGAAVDGAEYGQGTLWRLADPVLDVVSIGFVVVALGAVVLVAMLRRRWGLAIQAAVLIGGSNITTQLLKHDLLERPDYGITTGTVNSLPSGHTTVAASVAMGVLLVVPRSGRPAVAVAGAAYTAATGIATLVGQWHRPSDVIAAVLVVLAWTGLVCAFTPGTELDHRGGSSWTATALATVVLGGAGLLAGAVGFAVLTGSDLPVVGAATASSADVRAYVGTAALVASAVSVSFLGGLLVRQATARA